MVTDGESPSKSVVPLTVMRGASAPPASGRPTRVNVKAILRVAKFTWAVKVLGASE